MNGKRLARNAQPFVATLLVGAFAAYLSWTDWDFSRRAQSGYAEVVSRAFHYRSGQTLADAVHRVNGLPVDATLRAWYRQLRPGDYVAVCYLPDDPAELVLDEWWQRHFATIIALGVLLVTAAIEATRFNELRRRGREPL